MIILDEFIRWLIIFLSSFALPMIAQRHTIPHLPNGSMGMLIAVTGATGFLGHYIVNHLIQQGHQCRCWFRPKSNRNGFIEDGKNIEWLAGQLNDQEAAANLVNGTDAVVHAALARSGWNIANGELVDLVTTNIAGSLRLMQTARAAKVDRFIFISTCAVHDKILNDRPLDETHPLWPNSHYGAHKASIEKFVHSFGLGQGWPICALRPTGIYGLAHPPQQSRWLDLVRDVIDEKSICTAEGGKEVHATDVAKAIEILIAASPASIAGHSFNCYDIYVAQQRVAQITRQITGSNSRIAELNNGPKNQIDTSKLRALGMHFGGDDLLKKTISELVETARAQE